MLVGSPPDVTGLLLAWRGGDHRALEQLIDLVYPELHRLAHARMRAEGPGDTLQTTALVHEAFLRLVDARTVAWQDRAHFFAICAQAMRRILVDAARIRASLKRGGDARRVPLEERLATSNPRDGDLLALDEALTKLGEADLRKSQVVELRYFAGLTVEETAAVLGISSQTVMREWKMAKLWLLDTLRSDQPPQLAEER